MAWVLQSSDAGSRILNLIGVAADASWIPALRAARIQPMQVLRGGLAAGARQAGGVVEDELTGYRAVLLDVDGTLVDSNDAHAHAWIDVGEEAGIHISFDEVRALIGMGSDKVLPRIAGVDHESDEGSALAERHGEIFRSRYLPSLSAFPGTRDMLEQLLAADCTLVVATSASSEDMEAILKQAGLADLLECKTNSDDVEDSKPDPDIVLAALRKSGVSARDAIMIGDTPYDIEAASRAGVRCVAFRCGGWWTDEDLSGAQWIFDGPADFPVHTSTAG